MERTFTEAFVIGRDEGCGVRVEAGAASRRHAEVVFEEGAWRLRDLGSTNGTYVDGCRVEEVPLGNGVTIHLGEHGPEVQLSVSDGPSEKGDAARDRRRPTPAVEPPTAAPSVRATGPSREGRHAGDRSGVRSKAAGSGEPSLNSTQEYVHYYFGDGGADAAANTHTQRIRRAYAEVQRRQRRRYRGIVAVVLLLGVAALSVALWQGQRAGAVDEVHTALRAQEAEIARIRTVLEERNDASLQDQLRTMETRRASLERRFAGYVEEYGIRRGLTEEERVIFKVARIFNESHTEMPPAFVRAVRAQIHAWQTADRLSFTAALRRASEGGYVEPIVRAMQRHGLPPEFFYLALQESAFRTEAVGPWTRFGHAKGMWQFIPETGAVYGLEIGPRADEGAFDPLDERHDFERSTDAAARYLRDIYGHLAHASGLLAMASYNWGEHRVVGKLDALLEGIPDDPQARSYWRFYTVYRDRMPEETKDYVIRIFSAAVIGDNPRLFGFDFDDPLQPYMDSAAVGSAAARGG